jgi:hypothetical protein
VAEHHGAERHPSPHGGTEEIHLPSPTLAPPIVGLGVTLLGFGILFGIGLVVAGGLLMVLGIAIWLINDAREFMKAGDHGHSGH